MTYANQPELNLVLISAKKKLITTEWKLRMIIRAKSEELKEAWNSLMSINRLPLKMMELLSIYMSKWTREFLEESKKVDQERVQKSSINNNSSMGSK